MIPAPPSAAPVRVLVVDDSVVIRRLLTQALEQDPGVEVVGTAANGKIALAKVDQLDPELVTLDIEMPEMDGIATVRALRAAGRRMPVIMFSTLTEKGAAATLDALTAGATDYVTKPTGTRTVQEALAKVAGELLPKIRALVPRAGAERPARDRGPTSPAGVRPQPVTPGARAGAARVMARQGPRRPVRAVLVGSSTGGPEALWTVLGALPGALGVPVLIVQHMPPVFTRQLAARLDRGGPTRVVEATGGELLQPGHAYLAPGDRHLELTAERGGVRTALSDGPPVNFCRPAVDVLFRSAVRAYGGDLLAVVLTGMGSDGRAGAGEVLAAGGHVLAQDQATSVVWGMPGAVAGAGYAHALLPLGEVAAAITRRVQGDDR